MWNASIIDITKNRGDVSIFVLFSNGQEKFTEEYRVSSGNDMDWLTQQVNARIQSMQDSYTFADTLVKGTVIKT